MVNPNNYSSIVMCVMNGSLSTTWVYDSNSLLFSTFTTMWSAIVWHTFSLISPR